MRNNPFSTFLVADSAIYSNWAKAIVAHGWLGSEVFYRAPLYPYSLAVLYQIVGERTLWVYLLQLAMSLATLALVGLAARRAYGPRAGWLAPAVCLAYAPFTFEEAKILPTATEVLLGVLALHLLLEAERTSLRRFWAAGSLCLGLVIIARPNYALVVPILLLWTAVRLRRRAREAVFPLLALVFFPSVVVGAVAARNYVVSGDVVWISANAGVTFAQGNNVRARGGMAVLAGFTGAVEDQQSEETAIAQRALGRKLMPSEVSRYWFSQGIRFICDSPLGDSKLILDKLILLGSSRELGSNFLLEIDEALSPVLRLAFLPFGILFAFSLIGLHRIFRERIPASALVAAFTGTAGMMLVFYVSSRYRMTLAPSAAILAGGGADSLWSSLGNRRRTGAMLCAIAGVLLISLPAFQPYSAKELDRGDAEYWANLGVAFASTGRPDRALWAVDRAIVMSPDSFRLYARKMQLLADSAPVEDLLRWAETTAERFPREYAAHTALAEVLEAQGRHGAAIESYRKALALAPSIPRIYARLCTLYRRAGDLPGAEEVRAEGLRRFPEDPELKRLHAAP